MQVQGAKNIIHIKFDHFRYVDFFGVPSTCSVEIVRHATPLVIVSSLEPSSSDPKYCFSNLATHLVQRFGLVPEATIWVYNGCAGTPGPDEFLIPCMTWNGEEYLKPRWKGIQSAIIMALRATMLASLLTTARELSRKSGLSLDDGRLPGRRMLGGGADC
jgi:hypothetical protein